MTWKDMKPLSLQADGYPEIFLMGRSVGEDGSNRLVPRVRPFRPGAKQDTTGPDANKFVVEVAYSNDLTEEGVDNGKPMYPDVIEDVLAQITAGTTITLNLPWKRKLRVKCATWSRREVADENRNGALVTYTFAEDNEDTLGREAFERVTAKASIERAVEKAQFDAESAGVWDGSLKDLTQLASELVGYMNMPNEYAQNIANAAARVRRAVEQVVNGFSDKSREGRDQLEDPAGALLRADLLGIAELAARAEGESRPSKRRTTTHYPVRDTDIWAIADDLKQPFRDLIDLNYQLEDVAFIPARTMVRVYAE